MQDLVHDVSQPAQALYGLCNLQCLVLEVGVHNLVHDVSQLVQALFGLCILQSLLLEVDECSHDHHVPLWSISVVEKCRLFLNLGVIYYPFGTLWELMWYVSRMCSEVAPGPTNVFVGRCTTRHIIHVYRSCGGRFGAKRSRISLAFRPREKSLPDLRKLFFVFFPFVVVLYFIHPAVVVHKIVLSFFLSLFCFS